MAGGNSSSLLATSSRHDSLPRVRANKRSAEFKILHPSSGLDRGLPLNVINSCFVFLCFPILECSLSVSVHFALLTHHEALRNELVPLVNQLCAVSGWLVCSVSGRALQSVDCGGKYFLSFRLSTRSDFDCALFTICLSARWRVLASSACARPEGARKRATLI